ncbi:MAG: hypothetical protein V1908_03180, partial [Candidatus Peregrinibacteria bacterium]
MANAPQAHPAMEAVDRIHPILETQPLDIKALDQAINEALKHKEAVERREIPEAIVILMRERLRIAIEHEALSPKAWHIGRIRKMRTLASTIDATRAAIAATSAGVEPEDEKTKKEAETSALEVNLDTIENTVLREMVRATTDGKPEDR